MRIHTLYYLLPVIRKSNYDCDISQAPACLRCVRLTVAQVEADLQIVTLGKVRPAQS